MEKYSKTIIFSLTTLFSLLTIIMSFHYSEVSGGTDLRNRIVGARAMGKGYSPYFYKWNPADGERLLDPNDQPARLVNGNTVTPAMLYILYPLSFLNYSAIRLIWTILQILAAILIVWMMLRRYEGDSPLTSAGIVVLGLLASDYWFMHIDRGQVYVFFALLFSFVYYTYTAKWKNARFISGFIAGLFIFLRPFAGIIGLGFLLHGKMNWVRGCIMGVITGTIFFVLPNPAVWQDYFRAMKEYGNEYLAKGPVIQTAKESVNLPAIEGVKNLTVFGHFDVTSMPPVSGFLIKLGFYYSAFSSYLLCGFMLLILSIFFSWMKSHSTTVKLFLFSYLVYMIPSLFLLNWPGPYNLIEWAFPLFLIVQHIQQRSIQMILLLTALLFLHNDPFPFHFQALCAEIILFLLLMYIIFSKPKVNLLHPA
jgi:hypothetical protein